MTKSNYINLHEMIEADRKGKLDRYIEENHESIENSRELVERYRESLGENPAPKKSGPSIGDVERFEFHDNF